MNHFYYTTGSPNGCLPPRSCAAVTEQNAGECSPCCDSMAQALQVLQNNQLSNLINFHAFSFFTDLFVVGSALARPAPGKTVFDNLDGNPCGSFSRFTPCSCDLIDASGKLYYPIPTMFPFVRSGDSITSLIDAITDNLDTSHNPILATLSIGLQALAEQTDPDSQTYYHEMVAAIRAASLAATATGVTASQLSLCSLNAVVFDAAGANPAAMETNYQTAKTFFQQTLCDSCSFPMPCPPCSDSRHPKCGRCRQGVMDALSQNQLPRPISLTAGYLILAGASILGILGDVLVLSNDEDRRFYYVCTDKIDLLGSLS